MVAANVGEALNGCTWVGIPFFGSGCEVKYIKARTIVCGDLHKHVINLADVISNPLSCAELRAKLHDLPFADAVLADAQARLREFAYEKTRWNSRIQWAVDYFVAAWMARNGVAGTDSEFSAGLSTRWNAAGGDSVTRFRNATESLTEWSEMMRRCTFLAMDFREFLDKCKDNEETGIYVDCPFFEGGEKYKHSFTDKDHEDLASWLRAFEKARVVCRFYEHPEVRRLYDGWTFKEFAGRKQTNAEAPELLVINRV